MKRDAKGIIEELLVRISRDSPVASCILITIINIIKKTGKLYPRCTYSCNINYSDSLGKLTIVIGGLGRVSMGEISTPDSVVQSDKPVVKLV